MDELSKLQQTFAAAMRDPSAMGNLPLIQPQNMSLYRNSIIYNHTQALRQTYPVIEKLVGHGFFNTAAYFYYQAYPATDSDFNRYGENFNTFLTHYTPTQTLYYLPPMATLEWVYHNTQYAAEGHPFNPTALSTIPASNYGNIVFLLQPSCLLLTFDYPIFDLWQACQQAVDIENFTMIQEKQYLIIFKEHYKVHVNLLKPTEFMLLSEFAKGINLAKTSDMIYAMEASFDLTDGLQQVISKGYINDFFIEK